MTISGTRANIKGGQGADVDIGVRGASAFDFDSAFLSPGEIDQLAGFSSVEAVVGDGPMVTPGAGTTTTTNNNESGSGAGTAGSSRNDTGNNGNNGYNGYNGTNRTNGIPRADSENSLVSTGYVQYDEDIQNRSAHDLYYDGVQQYVT